MKIVIAGGSGFLGRHLADAVASDGDDVVVLTRGQARAKGRIRFVPWIPDDSAGAWAREIDGAGASQRLRFVTLPSIAEVIATALLLRTIWVANSLDVILVMTGGGPGYATQTLPLYAFLRAYSGMEFGYGAALALILTALLLIVVFAYVRRAARELGR